MIVQYLFSGPKGDIPIGPELLGSPFRITPERPHPFLTLRDYFKAIEDFLIEVQGASFIALIEELSGRATRPGSITRLLIRSEKHGALYHLASIEIVTRGGHRNKFAISTAASNEAKTWLNREYGLLKALEGKSLVPYLPKVFFKGEVRCKRSPATETLSMFLSEWFQDYHEWHLSVDKNENQQKIRIWDQKQGYRFASIEEAFEIYKQASMILTLYYDTHHFLQIYPWHHAAGDFVVNTGGEKIRVRLTTARKYEPIISFPEEQNINAIIAIVYFFLNLSIMMRLDRLDGIGEPAWAGHSSLRAVIKGFFQALQILDAQGRYHLGQVAYLLSVLKAFAPGEILRLFEPLLPLYRKGHPGDLSLVRANLKDHAEQLYQVIQNFHL